MEQNSGEGVTNFESDVPSMEPTPNANEEDGMYSPSNVPETSLTPWSASKANSIGAAMGKRGQSHTKEPKKSLQGVSGLRGLRGLLMGQGSPVMQVSAQSESQITALPVRRDSLRKVALPQAKQKNKESFLERVSLPIYRGVVERVQHSSVSSPNSLENGGNVYGPALYDVHDGGSQKATDPRSGDNPGLQDHITNAAMDHIEGAIARNNDLSLPQQGGGDDH